MSDRPGDRLAEIKARVAHWPGLTEPEVAWLIGEVERLNLEVMRHQVMEGYEAGHLHGSLTAKQYLDQVVALRGALEALVAAIESPWWTFADTDKARAAAVALLAGPTGDEKS